MTTHLIITGKLTARTAVHIGSGNSNNLTDALIRRNGAGEPIIPGTAIAGALRAMLTRLAPNLKIDDKRTCDVLLPKKPKQDNEEEPCGCVICQLFGDVTPTNKTRKDEKNNEICAKASRLYVLDAGLQKTAEVSKTSAVYTATTIRDGVGINRTTRTAADTAKFDLEVLPQGTTFTLRLELRSYHAEDRIEAIDRQLLAIALSEWREGRAWLGGRVARGLGGFKLEELEITDGNLNQPDQLMAYLRGEMWGEKQDRATWLTDQLKDINIIIPENWCASSPITRRWIRAQFTLQATGPLVANDTTAATLSGFDHAPLMLGLDSQRKPVLTGASLRGVIRSHAEKIARTLMTIRVGELQYEDKSAEEQRVLRRQAFVTQCPACDPLVSRQPDKVEGKALESCDSLIKVWYRNLSSEEKRAFKEKDDVEDNQLCLACHLFGSTRRGSRLIIEDAIMEGDPDYKMLDFLAIDRFTGGGADGAKFDALVLWRPRFKVRLYLENPQEWELGWLALTLRDMACGWLHVGMGAAKGLGQVEIEKMDWCLKLGFLEDNGFNLSANGQPSGIYQVAQYTADVQGDWLHQAQGWVKDFNEYLKKHQTTRPLDLCDSYFGKVDGLYPIMPPSIIN